MEPDVLLLDLANAVGQEDEDLIYEALKPILASPPTAAACLLRLLSMVREVKAVAPA